MDIAPTVSRSKYDVNEYGDETIVEHV